MKSWIVLSVLLCMCLVLTGCPKRAPTLDLGPPQAVSVPDKAGVLHPFTYVAIKRGNAFLSNTDGFSLFDEDAKHVLTNVTPNNGILETLGGAAIQSTVPIASFVGPLIK